jgi:hypothetical protein
MFKFHRREENNKITWKKSVTAIHVLKELSNPKNHTNLENSREGNRPTTKHYYAV